jgi:hypothetical protein
MGWAEEPRAFGPETGVVVLKRSRSDGPPFLSPGQRPGRVDNYSSQRLYLGSLPYHSSKPILGTAATPSRTAVSTSSQSAG